MASYFCQQCFPQLALGVWKALGAREEWKARPALSKFLVYSHSHTRSIRSEAHHSALPLLPPPPAGAPSAGGDELGELEQWLLSIHSSFAVYAAALKVSEI
jgi:hypothetical protein